MSITQGIGLDALIERRIAAAMAGGEFDDLPGTGRPLPLDDDALVPEELRVANRILKNAGFVPPELTVVTEVYQLLGAVARKGIGARDGKASRLRALLIRLELTGRTATAEAAWLQYNEALARRADR